MSSLPVREMVLYKHGVGFFVREGELNGAAVTLTFREDEINDVLKSLAVFDQAGGQVLGIHYPTPMDTQARLAHSSIRLSDKSSLRDLIRDLRGRLVTAVFVGDSGSVKVKGRVIGLDATEHSIDDLLDGTRLASTTRVSILDTEDNIQVYELSQLRTITITDSQSAYDLTYFLDTSKGDDARRRVMVRLSEGDHHLVVHYVAPSPTWRVSYRLVGESDEFSDRGTAYLQGWGLFDNRLDEDLEDVKLTLVAGQPISFIYDLYSSRIPRRPTVRDESRVAPGPVEFRAGRPKAEAEEEDVLSARLGRGSALADAAPQALHARRALSRQEVAQSAPPAARAEEAGEFFQYVVNTPVSVKRGESALVPIIGSEISYRRELLYNGSKLPSHPVAALRFENNTGLTLERGPVTVVEDSDYKGEAVIPFTKSGNEVYVPYAVELGITVTERPQSFMETNGLHLNGTMIIFAEYHINQVTYVLENTTDKDMILLIEAPIVTGYELYDTAFPSVETATERRWQVSVPAGRQVEFTRSERRLGQRQEQLQRLDHRRLQEFLKQEWLDQATFDRLAELLDTYANIEQAQAELEKLGQEREVVYQQQEQLRANLSTLQAEGPEAALRNRMLGQLEQTQDRVEAINQRQAELQQVVVDANERINAIIESLE